MRSNYVADELQRLWALLEASPDWIWEVDERLRFIISSAKGSELLGCSTERILGRTIYEFIPSDEMSRVASELGKLLAQKQAFTGFVHRVRRTDGRIVVLEASSEPIFEPDGNLKGYRGISRDVTRVWSRVLRLEALYALAPIALYVVNRDLVHVTLNNAMAELYGKPVNEIVGQSMRDLRPERAREIEHDFALIDAGMPIPEREVEWQGRHFQVSVQPLRDMAGGVIAMLIASTDITERKTAEQALAEAHERLDRYVRHDALSQAIGKS
ncbi:MAG: PAS domain-containing protein [Betaproteobacteria bacterium]|nr:PAS domain-containing protein [Betaproteobacteria bacterium]